MSKYIQLFEGDGFTFPPEGGIINFSCCDCGLVHQFAFAIEEDSKIGFAIKRDNRRTGQLRRYKNYIAKIKKEH